MTRVLLLALPVLAVGGALGAMLAASGCSSSGGSSCAASSAATGFTGGTYGPMPPAGPDAPLPAGVTLQPDVVVVHGGASVLKALSPDHGVWTIDKNASGASGVAVGKVLLIAGVDCARVTALTDNGNGTLDATVEPVAFTDVLLEGSLDWSGASLDPNVGVIGQVPYDVVVADEQNPDAGAAEGGCSEAGADGGPTCMVRGKVLHPEGMSDQNTTATVAFGGWTLSFSAGTENGKLKGSATGTWGPSGTRPSTAPGDPAQTLGGLQAGVNIDFVINNIKSTSGSVGVSGGKLTSASMTSDVSGSADLNANMSNMSANQYPKSALVKLPMGIEFPFYWGPIPMYVSLSMAFILQPSLSSKMSVLGVGTHVDFSGTDGFMFNGGKGSVTGKPTVDTPANPLGTSVTPPEIGTMAVVLALQAPRIGLGIGTMAFGAGIRAGVFVDVVNSLGLTVESATGLSCRTVSWSIGAHGGGEMAIKAGTMTGVTHQITLLSPPTKVWYDPMIAACKP